MGEETLDPERSKAPDTHEGLYYCREVAPDSEEAHLPLHGPNQWPAEVGSGQAEAGGTGAGFVCLAGTYMTAFVLAAASVSEVFAVACIPTVAERPRVYHPVILIAC